MEWVRPQPVPVIVRVDCPCAAPLLTDTVNAELPEPGTYLGLNDALVCLGNPVTLKFTVAENGPTGVIVTV